MPKKHLTSSFIRNLTPQGARVEYYDQHLIKDGKLKKKGVKGLFIRLTKAGSVYFYYRYYFNEKSKSYKVGSYPDIGLSEARGKARELAGQVNEGTDPQANKQARKSAPQPDTFEYLANRYKAQHLPTLKDSTQSTYASRIDKEMIPAFKGMYIKNVTRGVIMELLEEIAIERDQPTHSNRVRAILSSMFTFGVQREIAEYNPVKTIKPLGDEVKRDRVLEESEIKNLWQAFEDIQEPMQSTLKMLLLLGQRKGETCRMQWDHIEFDSPQKRTQTDQAGNTLSEAFLADVWTIPKQLTKANRKHTLPLPPMATDIIHSLKNDSDYVFQSHRHKGEPVKWLHDAFKRAAKKAGIQDIRIHDLRRTAATYMAELGTDRTVLGKVLNHKGLAGDSQVTARYDRHGYMNEKQTALNRWSYKLQQIIDGSEAKIHKIGSMNMP